MNDKNHTTGGGYESQTPHNLDLSLPGLPTEASLWNSPLGRRAFLKKTGAATVATAVAMHGFRVQVQALTTPPPHPPYVVPWVWFDCDMIEFEGPEYTGTPDSDENDGDNEDAPPTNLDEGDLFAEAQSREEVSVSGRSLVAEGDLVLKPNPYPSVGCPRIAHSQASDVSAGFIRKPNGKWVYRITYAGDVRIVREYVTGHGTPNLPLRP